MHRMAICLVWQQFWPDAFSYLANGLWLVADINRTQVCQSKASL